MHPPRLIRTSSFRLTLLYAALFGASALILLALIYGTTRFYMLSALDADIESDVTELRQASESGGRNHLVWVIGERIKQMPSGPIVYGLQDGAGKILAGNLPSLAQQSHAFDIDIPDLASAANPDGNFHIHRIKLGNTGDFLSVGGDAHQLIAMETVVLRIFAGCFAVTLLLALGSGAMMSASLLRRIETVSRASREIMEGNLSQRIPLRGSDDEFDHLAASLNAMLDRTQSSMEGMRQISNDIAHDLRTPLTRLRQRLELTQRKSQSPDELRAAIDRSIVDTDAILDTFGALLRIAQIEGQAGKARFRSIDLSELLHTVAEVYLPIAEERGQQLALEIMPGLAVRGDRQLLMQLFANLLENAIRHSPPRASITLSAAYHAGTVETVIADTGPGIPEAAREKVFRRFYRLDSSRATPGQGLGLSLVAAIATLHETMPELSDNGPGLRVRLRFRPELQLAQEWRAAE